MLHNLKIAGYNPNDFLWKIQELWWSENSRAEEFNIDDYIIMAQKFDR
jgi:hypothetical protein